MSEPTFERLATEIDAVIHNGASVHLTHPYEVLRPANVLGTQEVLRFAVQGRTKPVCHASGTSVFLGCSAMSEHAPAPYARRNGGYLDTKWVAERLVWQAFERGVPGFIVRLGWISGHSQRGLVPESDAVSIFLRACGRLGAAPAFPNGYLYCTPVDLAAQVIVRGALEEGGQARACNLSSSYAIPERQLWARFAGAGRPVAIVSKQEWLELAERRFPLLMSVVKTVLAERDQPPLENAVARGIVGRIGTTDIEQLLTAYVPVWLGRSSRRAR